MNCQLRTAFCQQPSAQSGQPIYAVNAKYVQGVGPGYWPTAGTGLTLSLTPGSAFCNSGVVNYAGGTLAMAASATNYVYLDIANSCVPASNTTGFSDSTIPVATVVTGASSITTITDNRSLGFVGARILDGVAQADRFAGADAGAKIAAAIAALPSAGGVVDARGLQGAQALSANIFSGTAKPVTLVLGAGTYSVSVAQVLTGWANVSIVGLGDGKTVLQQTGTTNDVIQGRNVSYLSIQGITFTTTNVADQASGHAIDIKDNPTGASSHIRVTDCVFSGLRSDAIWIQPTTTAGVDHVWIERNRFVNNTNTTTVDASDVHLIGAAGVNNYPINHFWIQNNRMAASGASQNYHGVMMLQNCHYGVVEGNNINGKLWHGIVLSNEVNTTYAQPNNSDIRIASNYVNGSGRVNFYLQNFGRGVELTNNVSTNGSTTPTSGIQGGFYINGGATDACISLANNKSYLDNYEGIKISTSNLSGQTPANGGVCVVATGNEIDSPNQSGASRGLAITFSGTTNYLGQISFTGLKLTGDGTNAANVVLDLGTATVSGFKGLSFADSWLDKASYQLNTASVSGPQNISIVGGGVRNATSHAIFIDKTDQVTVKGVQVRDWNTSNGTGGCIVLNTNNNRFVVEGNNCIQTQGAAATSDQGIWITSSTNTNGYVGPNWVMGARSSNYNLALASSVFASPIQLRGTVALSAGSATVTFTAPQSFTSSSTYQCQANDVSAINAVKVSQSSGTSVTFGGTGTDTVNYSCAGY